MRIKVVLPTSHASCISAFIQDNLSHSGVLELEQTDYNPGHQNAAFESMTSPSPQYAKSPELVALGQQIKLLRSQLGLSQGQLADLANLERSYIGGIERGDNNVSVIKLKHVASALNITVSELIGRSGF